MFHAISIRSLLAALLLAASAMAGARETIPLYVGYADPPFGTQRDDSLTIRLAARLSAYSNGRYEFRAMQMPRHRLNLLLAQPGWKGVVAWANPVWYKDESMRRYAWSQPYMRDADLVVSNRSAPMDYNNAASMLGMRVGCIAGHRYVDMDPLFEEGRSIRDDVASELQNLQKLRLGRIDVTLIQASSMAYFREVIPDIDSWLHVARVPRAVYQRYLFTNRDNEEMMGFVNAALRDFEGANQLAYAGH
ncbi:transporter substrate-binding domain-containing protein [Oxalobacteraceae bacterium]|nr:transporter substrate-binding domain-containing protein [Oxalobacteraceae bacterium]